MKMLNCLFKIISGHLVGNLIFWGLDFNVDQFPNLVHHFADQMLVSTRVIGTGRSGARQNSSQNHDAKMKKLFHRILMLAFFPDVPFYWGEKKKVLFDANKKASGIVFQMYI